jgi:hypothetical protein
MYRHRGNTQGPRHRTRKTSDARLAQDIAASIRAHAEAGTVKTAFDYTGRGEVIQLVEELLNR